MPRFISVCCGGEKCRCGADAEHKVEETIFDDEPRNEVTFDSGETFKITRHPLTAYICHACFVRIMGPAAA